MNNLDIKYQDLLRKILMDGVDKTDRTGTGTRSIFGYEFRHDMSEGFPLLTTKKMAWNQIVSESLWFRNGSTDIRSLWKDNNHIWDGDWWKARKGLFGVLTQKQAIDKLINDPSYRVGFSNEDFDLGPIYGKQWRGGNRGIVSLTQHSGFLLENKLDQIKNLMNLLKTDPDSRRMLVSAWNVGELDQMVLPPCHDSFQVYTRELTWEERRNIAENILSKKEFDGYEDENGRWHGFGHITPFVDFAIHNWLDLKNIPKRAISLIWRQRSVDTFLGLPFNIASYGLLLTMLADEFNMVPDELIGHLGDCHLYNNHLEQAKEQINRDVKHKLPTVSIMDGMYSIHISDFKLNNYESYPKIKAKLNN